MTDDEDPRVETARRLRRDGRSRAEIRAVVGPVGQAWLSRALAGIEPAEWTTRPNAKDDLREEARRLRMSGASLLDVARALGVAKSTVSSWCRDLQRQPKGDWSLRTTEMHRGRWERRLAEREDARRAVQQEAAASVGELTDRELLLIGAAMYLCEGSKSKPWRRSERLVFINSDRRLIEIYLRWLELLGVSEDRLRFSISIHETADVRAAEQYWAAVAGVDVTTFGKPVIKRHRPETVRKNVGDDYRGCLRVGVALSANLYQRMEGIFTGIHSAISAAREP
jgi:transposase-like protein